MKQRTARIAATWTQLGLAIMAGATAAVGLLYGAICLVEAGLGAVASERQD